MNSNSFYTEESSPLNSQVKLGKLRPSRVRALANDTITVIIDSKERLSGTDYNFTVSVQKPILAPLNVQLTQASIPKIPNINPMDNQITVVSTVGTYSFTIPPGYYNQNSLVNALTVGLDTAFDGADSFVVSFNTLNRTISIQSNGGHPWFFSNLSSFIIYGSNVANFSSLSPDSDPATLGAVTQYSGPAGLIYSRYVAIRSNKLTAYAYEVPRSSLGIVNAIAVVSMVNLYDNSDFSVTNVYQGNIVLDVTIPTASILNTAQSGNALTNMDFQLVDEYGIELTRSLTLGSPYNAPELGAILWLTINV